MPRALAVSFHFMRRCFTVMPASFRQVLNGLSRCASISVYRQVLLEHGADPDIAYTDEQKPLHGAAKYGYPKIAEVNAIAISNPFDTRCPSVAPH